MLQRGEELLDSVQEQVGLRTETIVASARGLQYHSVTTHRVIQWLKQWLTAKEGLDFYPSLFHARGANNARASLDDSLDYMICKFLMWAVSSRYTWVGQDSIEGATLTNDELNDVNKFFPIEIADGSSSSAGEGRSRSTRANNTPNPGDALCNMQDKQNSKTSREGQYSSASAALWLMCRVPVRTACWVSTGEEDCKG